MNEKGFVPIILIIVIVLASAFVIKNVAFVGPQPTSPIFHFASGSATLAKIPSPKPVTQKSASPTISPKPAASTNTISPTSQPTSNVQSSSSNNPTSQTNTSTPNPVPTIAPTPTASPTSAPDFVKVTYPNGGESLHQEDKINVTWNTNIAFGTCFIQTVDSDQSGINITGQFDTWAPNESIAWTVNMGGTSLPSKQFKIYMLCHDANSGKYIKAYSDNYFTISQ